MLVISEQQIRRQAPGGALRACWRQWRAERRLAGRGIHFRDTSVDAVARAYGSMSLAEFEDINCRQDWANWRTIPRALNGHVPNRPLRVVDLGCGTGSSTQVLAWYAPAGSRITGYELAEPLLAWGRRRVYRHCAGHAVQVDFVCQGVTETLRLPTGAIIPDHSVDVVNASGLVGHHLSAATVPPLIAEARRVSSPAGVVMFDVGPALGGPLLRRLMSAASFEFLGHFRSGWWDPTGEMVFQASAH